MPHLDSFIPVADAIAMVFQPHVEAVIHDLAKGTVHHVAGGLSGRAPLDDSLTDLSDIEILDRPVIGPYPKTNWDGRKLKSITAILPGKDRRPIGLLCINVDISMVETLRALTRDFLSYQETGERPAALFHRDWREEANELVGHFVSIRGATPGALSADQRLTLIAELDSRGLFAVRSAVPYIAQLLNLSRATLYKALKAARDTAPAPTSSR
jgi:predicted transcriptional regulator YheO